MPNFRSLSFFRLVNESSTNKFCTNSETDIRENLYQVNGKSVRGWQSDDLLAEFSGNLSVTVTVITREDRTITDLFLMTNRENDLNYLWALRQLVKLRC